MIELIQQPNTAAFSGNPIDFCFEVDKPLCCSWFLVWKEGVPFDLSVVDSNQNQIDQITVPATTESDFVNILNTFFSQFGAVTIQPKIVAPSQDEGSYSITFCQSEIADLKLLATVVGFQFEVEVVKHEAITTAKFHFDDSVISTSDSNNNLLIFDQFYPITNISGPNNLPFPDPNEPVATYWEMVKDFLECRDPFMCDFTIEVVDGFLYFCANSPGVIQISDEMNAQANLSVDNQFEILQECEVVIQPFVEKEKGSGVFEKTARLAKCVVDDDGKVPFDLQSILHACMKKKNVVPDLPRFGTGESFDAVHTHKSYYLKYALQTNGSTGAFEKTDIFQAYYGGLNYHAYPDNTFFEDLSGNGRFLTWQKGPKKATQIQHEYLAYIFTDPSVTGVSVHVEVELEGGVKDDVFFPMQPVEQWCKRYFPAGYTQLGFCEKYPGQTVCAWTFIIRDQDDNILAQCDFVYRCHKKGFRYFLFENSQGGLDTLCLTAPSKGDIQKDNLVAERKLSSTYDKACGQLFSICNLTQESFDLTTAFLRDECELDYLKEMLRSEYIAEALYCTRCGCKCAQSSVGCYSPVLLKSGKYSRGQLGAPARRLRMKFDEAFKEQWYTPLECKCPDYVGLNVTVTKEELPGCCPIVGTANRVRVYRRRFGNHWRVYGLLNGLQNSLVAAGAVNIQFTNIVTDLAGNIGGIIPVINNPNWTNPNTFNRTYVRIPLATNEVRWNAVISFDIDCGNGVQQVQLRIEEICTVPSSNGWQLEFLTPDCVDLTTLKQCCIKIEAADSIAPGSVITSQTTTLSLDGGNSGTSVALPFYSCFDEAIVESIQVVREIKTSLCNEFLKLVENVEKPTPCVCELKLEEVLLASDDYTGNFISVFNDNRPGAVKAFSIQYYQSSVVFEFLVDLNCDVLQIGNYRFLSAACTFNSSPANSYQEFSIYLNFDFDSFNQFGDCAEKAEEIMNEMISSYNTFEDDQQIWHPEFTCYNLICE